MSYADLQTAARFWRQAERLKQRIQSTLESYAQNKQPTDIILGQVFEEAKSRLEALEETIMEVAAGEPWLDRVRHVIEEEPGFGRLHLCVIGLIPPVPNFPNPAKLWKWLSAEPPGQPRVLNRAATRFLRSVALFRPAQNVMQNRTEPWRSLWDARRAHTAVTHADWSKMHSLLDAHRYVSKRMWVVLWRAAHDLPLNMPVAGDHRKPASET